MEKSQPRTDTATLIKSCRLIWLHLQPDDEVASTALREIADRLEEQEEAFRNLEISFGKMTEMAVKDGDTIREQEATIRHLRVEICNASAILMTHLETIKTIQAEVDLLNSRPKR
jgi:hypothetical protein